jgi:hypothetical protein
MAGENDIQIKVEIDDATATAKLTQLDGSIKEVQVNAEKTAGGFSRLEATTVALSSAVSLAQVAFAAVTGATSALFAAIERGSAIDDVSSAFANLTAKAGGTAEVFLNELKSATGQTITSFDLMRKANEALQSGIKPDQYIELTKAARALAEETGGNLTEELAKLERAFATGRETMLKNRLGVIDIEKAQEALAKSLGVTKEELSEEGKLLAARNAIIDAAKKKTQEFGKIENDAGDAIARVGVILGDYRDAMLKAVGTSQTLTKLIALLGDAFAALEPLVDLAINAFKLLDEIIVSTIETLEKVNNALSGFRTKVIESFRVIPGIGQAMQAFDIATAALAGSQEAAAEEIKKTTDAAENLEGAIGTNKTGAVGAVDSLADAFDRLVNKDAGSAIGDLFNDIKDADGKAGEELFDFEKAVMNGFESAVQALGSAVGSGDFKGALSGVGNAFSQALGGILSEAMKNGKLLDSLAPSLGSAAGPIGSIIGSVAGPAISSIVDSIFTDIENGNYLDAFATSLDTIFPGVGSFSAKIVDSLFGGGDSAGTEAKKSADKFFADLLDANRVAVVIDGQLQQISDLVFSGNQGGVGLFAGLEPAAQEAFRGVGSAFQSLLGISEQLGVDIGNVFANNLGGSLNNLQILVQQTGVSFDQLRSSVVKAFLDGKLSASQAAEALKGIEQISQKGIPDALGAVDQAFQNLIDSGTSGGAALVDALGDIASEAKEISITSFQQVRDFLTNSGKFTEEQISQLFAALAENGIDSIEELENITALEAIDIVNSLDKAGLAFSDVGSAVTNIAEELNNIPSEIRTTVRVRYVAEGDPVAASSVGQEMGVRESSFLPSGEGVSTSGSPYSGSRRPSSLTGR